MNKAYTIPYKSLPTGEHTSEFRIDASMFAEWSECGITDADATVVATLTKSAASMTLDLELNGTVTTPCDRCLEDCTLPVSYSGRVAVRVSEEEMENDDEVIWLNPGDDELDLEQYLRESIILSLPYQRVHPCDVHGNPLCNPAMLERFRIVTGEEFDRMTEAEEVQTLGSNPELQKLKDLKFED
jgi:uncharacterized metal-binding protein YceD (DUF177 family)